MAKGPNHRPDKGFSRELLSNPKPTPKPKHKFAWEKAIVKPTADAMATPHRLANHKAVKEAKPEFTKQQQAQVDKKRGIK